MNVIFEHPALLKLVSSLFVLTGIRVNVLDPSGRDICLCQDHAPFCTLLNATTWGHDRCLACDRQAVHRSSAADEVHFYHCHAGIREAVLPLRSVPGEPPLAYLIFGQLLDSGAVDGQWEQCRQRLAGYPGDLEQLRLAFLEFRQCTTEELRAYARILQALESHIVLQGMVLAAEDTDLQRLNLYLEENYREKLTLASISRDLHVGRTKLCSLARELSGGHSLSYLIARRRIRAAKELLIRTDLPIAAVAAKVGIDDYNYFTKTFRSVEGTTPTAYRKEIRRTLQAQALPDSPPEED